MSERAGEAPAADLPPGWVWAELGELGNWYGGSTPSKRDQRYWGGDIPWVSPKDMKRQRIVGTQDHLTRHALTSAGPPLVPAGAVVLVVRSGILRHTVPMAVTDIPATLNQDMKGLVPFEGVHPEYLFWALKALQPRILEMCTKHGTTVHNIITERLYRLRIPLAPLAEQRRIFEKIEALLSGIANGADSLNTVDRRLDTYRQATLKAGVTGELTSEWRAYADLDGDGEDAARQAALALEQRSVRAGKISNSEPVKDVEKPFKSLPPGWTWTRLYKVAEVVGGITKDKKRDSQPHRKVPYLRVANVQKGYLDLSNLKEISAPEDAVKKLKLEPGDVLFTEGGDRDKLGRGWIWEGQVPECIHQNHILRARFFTNYISPKFVSWYANIFGQTYFMGQGTQTTNLASISLSKLKSLPIPVPPAHEARKIVEEVDQRLTTVDSMRSEFSMSARTAGSLRQSVLNAAFVGRLVPQDANDEPASDLLARIRAERAQVSETGGRRGRPRRTTRATA